MYTVPRQVLLDALLTMTLLHALQAFQRAERQTNLAVVEQAHHGQGTKVLAAADTTTGTTAAVNAQHKQQPAPSNACLAKQATASSEENGDSSGDENIDSTPDTEDSDDSATTDVTGNDGDADEEGKEQCSAAQTQESVSEDWTVPTTTAESNVSLVTADFAMQVQLPRPLAVCRRAYDKMCS